VPDRDYRVGVGLHRSGMVGCDVALPANELRARIGGPFRTHDSGAGYKQSPMMS
jgi:hypothetical protein